MKLSKVIFPDGHGVHVGGQTRYVLKDDLFSIDATSEGLIVKDLRTNEVSWIPSERAESGVVIPEIVAPAKKAEAK